MKKILILGVSACVFFLVACEREGKNLAEVDAPVGTPEYTGANKATEIAGTLVAEVSPTADQAPDGATLYASSCAACHQLTGQGVPGAFPPLDGSPYVVGDNVERMASIMLYGLTGPITVKGTLYNSAMTPWNHLKDKELAAIATYVRSNWSNKAGPVSEEVFAKMRAKWGTRGSFTISELGEEK